MKITHALTVPLILGTLLNIQPCHAWRLLPTKQEITFAVIASIGTFAAIRQYYFGQERRLLAAADARASELSKQMAAANTERAAEAARLQEQISGAQAQTNEVQALLQKTQAERAAEAQALQEQLAATQAQRAAEANELHQQLVDAEIARQRQAQTFQAALAAFQEANTLQHGETQARITDGTEAIRGAVENLEVQSRNMLGRLTVELQGVRQDIQFLPRACARAALTAGQAYELDEDDSRPATQSASPLFVSRTQQNGSLQRHLEREAALAAARQHGLTLTEASIRAAQGAKPQLMLLAAQATTTNYNHK